MLARLDKDLLITICLQAEEQRRVALAEQMAASDAAAKAKSEVAQLRQTVAVLQQAIISLPQQPQQHMQHRLVCLLHRQGADPGVTGLSRGFPANVN